LSCNQLAETKQLWSWRRSSIVLSLRTTETNLTATRTQDTFGVLTYSKYLTGSQA
jgi:hypothetical protein